MTDDVVEFKGEFYNIPASKIGPKPQHFPWYSFSGRAFLVELLTESFTIIQYLSGNTLLDASRNVIILW